jgi:ribonuclease I
MLIFRLIILIVGLCWNLEGRTRDCPHFISCSRGQHGRHPGDFDYFELALSSAPKYCQENVDARSTRECTENNPPYGLVLHGLWPTNEDGTFPQACGPLIRNDKLLSMLDRNFPRWRAVAPGFEDCLAAHEWFCHGSCSGLSPEEYFGLALSLAEEKIRQPGINVHVDHYFNVDRQGKFMHGRHSDRVRYHHHDGEGHEL